VKLILITLFAAFYLFMAIRFFRSWWVFFRQDTDQSKSWAYISIAVIILASAFWPVVVPFAYLELLEKVRRNAAMLEANTPEMETCELDKEAAEEPENFVSSVEL